jgi:hypothetical protein
MHILLRAEWLDADKNYPFPVWTKIHAWMKQEVPPEKRRETWNELAREWMTGIGAKFSEPMRLSESPHFILNAPLRYAYAIPCLHQLEDYRARISQSLGQLCGPEWGSKSAVIVAPSPDDFTTYILEYCRDGEFARPGGVYLNRGFGHFVVPNGTLTDHSETLAHELCHALIGTRDMPMWLNEAVTQDIESQITGRNRYMLDREMIQAHQAYWTADRLKSFWRGDSFSFPDDGNRLSYHLARFLLNAVLQHGKVLTVDFILAAKRADAGFDAARSVLKIELSDVVSGLLGKSSWIHSQY